MTSIDPAVQAIVEHLSKDMSLWRTVPWIAKDVEILIEAIRSLSAQVATLTADRDALDAKVNALSPHGTCGCSYDKPDDLCLYHSPQVVKLKEQVATLTKKRDEALDNMGKRDNFLVYRGLWQEFCNSLPSAPPTRRL